VRGQAVEVAKRMGIMPRVRAAATDVIGTSFVDSTNRSVARIDMRAIQRKYGSGEAEIMRGDLVAILHEATKDDVEYVFDDSIRTLQQDNDGVTVTFERGATHRFDLVIGADGVHSAVRRLIFGPEERFLRYLRHYFAFATADPALGADRWMTIYNLPGKMAGVYRSGNHTGAKAYLMFRQPEPLGLPPPRHRAAAAPAERSVCRRVVVARAATPRQCPGRPRALLRLVEPGPHAIVVIGSGDPRR
jgi:2-polyprenyl-6-methoxyphenol hydroxylase-like FAD-dependent oxidoreductase